MVEVTAKDGHLAQVIHAMFDKPIPLDDFRLIEELIARHRIAALREVAADPAVVERVARVMAEPLFSYSAHPAPHVRVRKAAQAALAELIGPA